MANELNTAAAADALAPSRPRAMHPFFAVFNGHINNADERARRYMARRCPTYLAEIEELEREGNGIMCLFDKCGPTWGSPAARRYIRLVTAYVNANRDMGTADD